MIQMKESQLRQAKKLIQRLCANYDGGECLVLDCDCPQCHSYSLLCRYFREAVLPVDKELHAEIYGSDKRKKCESCGKMFVPTGNRAKYCGYCAKVEERKRTRERVRRHRGIM